jgi:hypothetical protein
MMTARRRRKSGSGPSATALIAWVGGTRTGPTDYPGTPVSVGSAPEERVAGGRAILFGRACGLAAGTLLACGSVLVGATHVGDGSLATDSASLLSPTPTTPGTTAGAPAEVRADTAGVDPAPAAPDPVRAQTVADPSPVVAPRLGRVRRNTPVSVEVPSEVTQHPDTAQQPGNASRSAPDRAPAPAVEPISPVLDPATRGVGQVTPVGGILAPTNPNADRADHQFSKPLNGRASRRDEDNPLGAVETVNQVVAPVGNAIQPVTRQPLIQPATRPAMAMLTSLLPIG